MPQLRNLLRCWTRGRYKTSSYVTTLTISSSSFIIRSSYEPKTGSGEILHYQVRKGIDSCIKCEERFESRTECLKGSLWAKIMLDVCSDRKSVLWLEHIIATPHCSTEPLPLPTANLRALHLHEPLLGVGASRPGQGEQHQGRRWEEGRLAPEENKEGDCSVLVA